MRVLAALCSLSGLLIVLASGCSRAPADTTGWNLLLITLDTTRADRLGCYGYESADTPILDRIAENGALFSNANAHSPLTLPSHASMLTGLYPPQHGARGNGLYRLDEGHTTLAERLRENGYQTAAVVGSFVLDGRFGLAQGFSSYDDDEMSRETEFTDAARRAPEVTAAALGIARGLDPSRPYFLWVHYFDPHAPYTPPSEFRARFADDLSGRYDAEIATMDHQIGVMLDGLRGLDLMERTLVVVTGDHGEGFPGPHNEQAHGIFLYQDTLLVPFLISSEDGGFRGRFDALVRHVDISPTVLDLLGIKHGGDGPGRSLREVLLGQEIEQEVGSYAEATLPYDSQGWSPLYQLRDRDWKLIEAPRPELYDLKNDPLEMDNLYREDHPRVTSLGRRLQESQTSPHGAGSRDLSEETRSRLATLGYVFSGPGEDSPGMQDLKDPKDLVHLMAILETGRNHLSMGRVDAGLECFNRVLVEDPANLEAHHQLGNHFRKSRDWSEAESHYRSILGSGHSWPAVHAYLGEIRHQQGLELEAAGRSDEARASFEEAIESLRTADRLDPREGTHAAKMGSIYWEDLGDVAAAERSLRESLKIMPVSPPVNMVLALLLAGEKRYEEALPHFDTALMGDELPQDLRIRLFVEAAKTQALLGRYQQAGETMAALIGEFPNHPNAAAWLETRLKLRSLSGG